MHDTWEIVYFPFQYLVVHGIDDGTVEDDESVEKDENDSEASLSTSKEGGGF